MATATNDKAIVLIGLELIDRGGPYDGREQQTIVSAANAQSERDAAATVLGRRLAEVARKFRAINPAPAPQRSTPYDREVEDATIAFEAARLNEERTRDLMFDARAKYQRLVAQDWASGGNGFELVRSDKSSTPETRDLAADEFAAAQEAWRVAEDNWRIAARRLTRASKRRNDHIAINIK